jgi:glutamate 5-kinase
MIIDENNLEIARGLVSYDKIEAEKIIGFKSEDISNILGYENGSVLIHRDNLVVM